MTAILLLLAAPALVQGDDYQTDLTRWRAADNGFAHWRLTGVTPAADGTLELDPATAESTSDPYPAGGYRGRNYYNGGTFLVGEAVSPLTATDFGFRESIASWNAHTPAQTWLEAEIRVRIGGRLTRWYSMGIWGSGSSPVERHSVDGQRDGDGSVSVDTLVVAKERPAATAHQLRLRLFSSATTTVPRVRSAAVAVSGTPSKPSVLTRGSPARWNRILPVPECSQMVYPDGGEAWCSPTSTAMVVGYWGRTGAACEPRVRAAVAGVFDWVYDGHGNWPFNTAYAATQGLEGYVARFTSFAELEELIAAGVPVVISYAWGRGSLSGAPIPASDGHLAVLVGFDQAGNAVVNDPAAATDGSVRRTYRRSELESLWLEHSGGTAYVLSPEPPRR